MKGSCNGFRLGSIPRAARPGTRTRQEKEDGMPSTNETYTVTVTFKSVRGVSDMMLRLVRLLGWIDSKHDLQGFRSLVKRRQPISIKHNGRLSYGTIKVTQDA